MKKTVRYYEGFCERECKNIALQDAWGSPANVRAYVGERLSEKIQERERERERDRERKQLISHQLPYWTHSLW